MSTARPDKPEVAPLYCIASLRFRYLAKHFIAKSIQSNVNTTGTGGYEVTPMHFAVSAGHANIFVVIIITEHGADVKWRGRV